jgi:Fe-S-cluster containining protein
MKPVKFFWLNFHVGYACRHSGMCCSSGWPIPVEKTRVAAIEATIAREIIPLRVEPWLVTGDEAPDDVAGMLALRSNGHCVFFEAGRPGCSIHDVKPAGCVHFPYLSLIDPRGVHVTLSHYCPTAASMLFEHNGPIAIVQGPPPVGDGQDLEGLDARESLPPTFAAATVGRPGAERPRLMSFDELTAWERDQVARASIDELHADDVALFERARASVPAPWIWPDAPERLDEIWWSQVAPSWPRFNDVLTRYAAAKVFASWSLYLGDGLDAASGTARIAGAVLRIECARQCAFFQRPLDRELMTEAIRQSDLLLVHYADPALLAASSLDRPRD